jgi:sarcosine oxidase/L-pipecolate oxidase
MVKNLAHLDPEMELSDLTGWKGRQKRETSNASRL